MSIETITDQHSQLPFLESMAQSMPLWFQQGGVVMWLLLFASFLTTIVTLERLFVWILYSMQKEHFALQACFAALNKREKTNALLACQKAETPSLKMLEYGIKSLPFSPKEKMKSYAENQINLFSRGQSLLGTVIKMAPILGVLGTILGIIDLFNVLSLQGIEDLTAVVGGIADALISTAAGLSVALLALLPHNFFRSLIQKLALDLKSVCSEFNHICQQNSFITNQLNDITKKQKKTETQPVSTQKDMPYHYEFSKETGEVNVSIHAQSKNESEKINRATPSSIAKMFNEELPSIYKHIKPEPEQQNIEPASGEKTDAIK